MRISTKRDADEILQFCPKLRIRSLWNHCIEEMNKKHGLHCVKEVCENVLGL